jgi:cytochrome P450
LTTTQPVRTDEVTTVPPGPQLPVAIQTLLFGRYRHRYLPMLRKRYGDIFMVRIAQHARRLVIVSNPDDIHAIFAGPNTVFHAGEGNAILEPIMGEHSVLLLDESEHLRVRQLLMPAFHGSAMRGYTDLIDELAREAAAEWPAHQPIQLHLRMQALTLEIILQVVFGVTDSRRLEQLRPVVTRVLGIGPVIMLGWFYPRLRTIPPWRQYAEMQRSLDGLLYAEIAERRAAADLDDRTDVLSMLLRTSRDAESEAGGLTDAELRDNLVTLLLAGHETTATALAWAFHELARDHRQLLLAQQAADRDDTRYLEAVTKESMRLHPVIYEVARRVTQSVEVGGYLVPAGATVMPGIGIVQSDPAHHADPARFDPSRFLDGQPAPNTWIPFGGGVRRCLGAGFSLLEATAVLREVLRSYDLSPDRPAPEAAIARNITLAPGRGARVVLSPRRPTPERGRP